MSNDQHAERNDRFWSKEFILAFLAYLLLGTLAWISTTVIWNV